MEQFKENAFNILHGVTSIRLRGKFINQQKPLNSSIFMGPEEF